MSTSDAPDHGTQPGICHANPNPTGLRVRGEARAVSNAEWIFLKLRDWYRHPDTRVLELATLPFGWGPKAGGAAVLGAVALSSRAAKARQGHVFLYHGTRRFEGTRFDLAMASKSARAGTAEPGIHLTDDAARAMTAYGRQNTLVRVELPIDVAARYRRPRLGQEEFFFGSKDAVDALNSGAIKVYSWAEALADWMKGLL